MKIGILGGTFDPIHNAHIKMAIEAKNQYLLDKVYIMPTPYPPHKDKSKITSDYHRVNMIKLGISGIENVELYDYELNKSEPTYTAKTLWELKTNNPLNDYYFIVGSDSIISFLTWYHPEDIFKYANLLAVKRDDESGELFYSKIAEIESLFNVKIGVVDMEAMDESSSDIRSGSIENIKGMVPASVYKYIVDNNLYTDKNINKAWSISKILKDLKDILKESRYIHTLNVAQTAKNMAESFGINPNQAYLAGILHDCAKNLSDNQLLDICINNNIEITKSEKAFPYLLHGKVGAFFANSKYGVTDKNVLSAIAWHTTGKPDMTDLEKIIFCADYIEPGRTVQPNLEKLRDLSKTDLDLLTYYILKDTVEYLKREKADSIDEMTIKAYEFYENYIKEK